MNIDPGELDKRITLVTKEKSYDSEGFLVETENTAQTWASFSRLSGTELMKSNAETSEIKARFLIRYRAGINTDMVIRYAGDDYNVNYVNDYEDRHEYIELLTTLRKKV